MGTNEALRLVRGGPAVPSRRAIGTSALLALATEALEIRRAETAEALLFNHVLHNGAVKERNLPSLLRLFRATIELGHAGWPVDMRRLYQNKDVLHFGSGQTLYCAAFRALGARSYTGADPNIDIARKKFRSRISKQTVDIGISLSDVVRLLSGIAFVDDQDLTPNRYDLVLLQSITHKLPDLPGTLDRLHKSLRPGGQIWFLHENFYGWGGHLGDPRTPASLDPANPQHQQLADWGHLTFDAPAGHRLRTAVNRVRPSDLRASVDALFEIEEWKEVRERPPIVARLTPAVRERLQGYSDNELLLRQIVCVARKRPVRGAAPEAAGEV